MARPFDCVEMKSRVQARLAEEFAGLTDDQVRRRLAEELTEGDDPVARKWRALTARRPAARPRASR
jgi:hypothetical protein